MYSVCTPHLSFLEPLAVSWLCRCWGPQALLAPALLHMLVVGAQLGVAAAAPDAEELIGRGIGVLVA